jgi:ATP-binding cassette subfamily F protein 3
MLRIDRLKKTFGPRVLFQDVTYHFPEAERVALVGANGAGKTTLLNILCGLDQPDDGTVLAPSHVSVGYLPQKPNPEPEATVLRECEAGAVKLRALRAKMDEAMQSSDERSLHAYEQAESAYRLAGGYALESRATSILKGLGFTQDALGKDPRALSGGWRMRLELARLFIRDPDFLILDEPTNHLDLPSLVWVESYLQSFRGTLLFVSHDRALLNRLATITLHLSSGRLTPYKGNFDRFLAQREARLEQDLAAKDQLRRRREAMEHFVERFGAKATKATQAQSRVKMIAKIRDLEDEIPTEEAESSVFIDIPTPPPTARIVLRIESGAIGYDRPLAAGIKLQVEKGAKVAIIGANGIGKSTLLRTIAGRLQPIGGEFQLGQSVTYSYFAQEQTETLDPKKTVLQNLLSEGMLGEREARNLLGSFLFRGDDVKKTLSVLSGGEASRLGLACALARRAGLLLLDEPTNHLDMSSVESLAASLADWEGTAIFVSHDRTFIDGVATHVFAMLPDGRSMLFEGQLADYARLAAVAGFPNVLAIEPEAPPAEGKATKPSAAAPRVNEDEVKELKRQRQTVAKKVDKLDADMSRARAGIHTAEAALAAADPTKHEQTTALFKEKSVLESQLDRLETEWLEASELLESINERLSALGRG